MAKEKHVFAIYKPVNLETLKGKVELSKQITPDTKKLGEPHPFDFKLTEGLYLKEPLVHGAIDKTVDFVVGPGFFVTSGLEKAKNISDDFIRDTQFESILREWLKEALVKGNGFMEIGFANDNPQKPEELKIIDASTMFIKRNVVGEVEEYNQMPLKMGDPPVSFKPHQIAHLPINKIGSSAYGFGEIFPPMKMINWKIGADKDMHTLLSRKANSPIIVNIGDEANPAGQADINKIGADLEFLNAKHEWTADHLTKFSTLNFGNIGEKFEKVMDHDQDNILASMQVPKVLLGFAPSASLALAQTQMQAFMFRIKSLQQAAEKVLEEQLFSVLMVGNKLAGNLIEFEWGQPTDEEKRENIKTFTEMMKSPFLSPTLRDLLEKEIAELLDLQKEFETNKQERDREETEPQPRVPGQNNPKNVEPPKPEEHVCSRQEEIYYAYNITESRDFTLNEWLGFDYGQYLEDILEWVNAEEFVLLRNQGFTDVQVAGLQRALSTGFNEGKSIRDIAADIRAETNLPSLKTARGTITARRRALIIARTETVRASSEGALKHFGKTEDIKLVQWVATASDRTCPICEARHGEVFPKDQATGLQPAHVACRCTWIPIVEGFENVKLGNIKRIEKKT